MNYRPVVIFSILLACLLLAVIVNVIYGIDIVYTHLFYIPIILTGIWYPRYVVFCAAALGLIHVACDYASIEAFKSGSFLRAVMFIVVAYVTGHLTLRRDRLLNSLRESEAALKKSQDDLEQHVAERTEELIRVNEELQTDITDRKRVEEKLQIQNRTFSEVLNGLDALVYVVDMKTDAIIFINTYGQKIWGDIKGKICWQTIQEGQTGPCKFCTNSQLLGPDGNPTAGVVWESQNTVTKRWYDCRDKALYWPDGRIVRMEIAADITERKQAEEKIKASLREKDILISEIHHRVKNNLQVISGLLDLQAKASKNPEVIENFRESQNRIYTMAMVHEKLYNSDDYSKIDLADYARSLSQGLFQSHELHSGQIDLTIQTNGEVYVDIIKAIPCGLILNELISNALKHAFPGDGPGKLQIIIRETKDTEIEIVVRDNGVGLPDDVDIHQPRSVGLTLVNGLAKQQLDGQIEVSCVNGTEFRITFPL